MHQETLRKEKQILEEALALCGDTQVSVVLSKRITDIDRQLLPLKLYLFRWDDASYEESRAMIVVATSPEHALEFAHEGDTPIYVGDVKNSDIEIGILVHDFWEG